MTNKAQREFPYTDLDTEIEELKPKIAPEGGETVLPIMAIITRH